MQCPLLKTSCNVVCWVCWFGVFLLGFFLFLNVETSHTAQLPCLLGFFSSLFHGILLLSGGISETVLRPMYKGSFEEKPSCCENQYSPVAKSTAVHLSYS